MKTTVVQTTTWIFYQFNQWGMAVYWVLYLRFIYTDNLLPFAHMMAAISFLYLVSQVVYFMGKHVD